MKLKRIILIMVLNKLEFLPVKELQKICSNLIDDDETYRINNYTKIKKAELIEKMNSIYDMLKFD